MTKLHLDGTEYGPHEAYALRKNIIAMRNAALKANDFDAAVEFSHTIGLFSLMAEYVWGQEWKDVMERAKNDV